MREAILRLERALATRDPSGLERPLADYVADGFVEIGRSGQWWDAAAARASLSEPRSATRIEAFDVALLAPTVALATWLEPGPPPVRRTSLWIREDDEWRIRFHQGTVAGAERR